MPGNRLQGKVAVIIGGASGIGQNITDLFLQHGAKVIVAYEQDSSNDHKHFLEKLKQYGPNATPVSFDVGSDVSVVQKALGDAKTKLDILVINASKPNNVPDPKILANNIEQFTRALHVNVHRAFLGAKLATDLMIQAKKGVILFTSGDALLTTEACPYVYAMSKHALFGLAYNLSAELRKQNNIRVSYISPPPSPKMAAGTGKKREAEGTIGTWGNLKEVVVEAEKVAEAALDFITGQPSGTSASTPSVISGARRVIVKD